jgi:hypothetical protein
MNWSLPADAGIVSGQNSDTLVMNWGIHPGTVILHIENTCGVSDVSRYMRYYGQYAYPSPDDPHLIPGRINPVEYDYGGEGISYHDATHGNAGTGPRSDESVDTENAGDTASVGWIDANEWLEYSIQVQRGGNYFFGCLAASQNLTNMGPLVVKVNNTIRLSNVSMNNTGSWSAFMPTAYYIIELSPSDTLLRLETGAGGFNLGLISILEHLPSAIDLPVSDKLTIYPVPAVSSVFIRHPDGISGITITDLSGKLYHAVTLSRGTKEYEADVHSFPAGLYLLSVTDWKKMTLVRKFSKLQ